MDVMAFDPAVPADAAIWNEEQVRRVSLEALLGKADVVSLHVPLTDATRNLLNAARLEQMKPGAILINAARGGIVDEAALCDMLRRGRLGGAQLDVFESEPLLPGNRFEGVPRLLLTPHIAGVTAEAEARIGLLIAAEVARRLRG
jgi:(S)-sulfolactate dehydrogenase